MRAFRSEQPDRHAARVLAAANIIQRAYDIAGLVAARASKSPMSRLRKARLGGPNLAAAVDTNDLPGYERAHRPREELNDT